MVRRCRLTLVYVCSLLPLGRISLRLVVVYIFFLLSREIYQKYTLQCCKLNMNIYMNKNNFLHVYLVTTSLFRFKVGLKIMLFFV